MIKALLNTAKARLVLVILLFAAALLFGGMVGLMLPRLLPGKSAKFMYNTASVVRQIQTLSHLVTVKYVIEKVVILEDVKWFGESRVLLLAHGVVKAGIDLGELKADDVKISETSIRLRLPPAKITDVYLDEKRSEVIERSTGLLRNFDKDLEQSARRQAVDDIRRAARVEGILKDASDRARLQLRGLLTQLGFMQIEFTE